MRELNGYRELYHDLISANNGAVIAGISAASKITGITIKTLRNFESARQSEKGSHRFFVLSELAKEILKKGA